MQTSRKFKNIQGLRGLAVLMVVFEHMNTIEKRYTIVAPKWLCKIGDASYSIYLSHILVLSAVGVIWRLSSADEYLNNMVMLLIMFVSVIFVGYFSFRFIERPVLKITQLVEKKYLASSLKTDIANDS